MTIAELSIKNPLICCIAIVLALAGGTLAYLYMPRFEDPEFTIRIAKVMTAYPGASAEQVMDEVTEPLEVALQQLPEVQKVESTSSPGLSDISVEIRYSYSKSKSDLQVVWSRVRNKVNDAQANIAPGAGPTIVHDDFGDVYGLYYLLTGEGYTAADLSRYAKSIRKELLKVSGVAKVAVEGEQQEVIYIEVSKQRAASLGVSLNAIYDMLDRQNEVTASGSLSLGEERLQIRTTGGIGSVDDIENLLVGSSNGVLTRLGSVADVYRGYEEPRQYALRYDGQPALGLGVSNLAGINVVAMGERIDQALIAAESQRPVGMELHEYYHQGKEVDKSIQEFAWNVLAALAIVFFTLLVFMGFRSGIVMGLTVLITMASTLLIMWLFGIPMHRISLGALVISLGMLVDNGVVVTDGILVGVKKGAGLLETAKEVSSKNMRPLLGGTLVGIIAFAPIGFAPGDTAEYTGHLFWVVLIALGFSWLYAFTLTPIFCHWFFKPSAQKQFDGDSVSTGRVMGLYKSFIAGLLRFRFVTLILTLAIFCAAIWGFQFIKDGFFPASTTPQVAVDYSRVEGTDFESTAEDLLALERYVSELEGVEHVQTLIGGGALRYMLVYDALSNNTSVGQLLIRTSDYKINDALILQIQAYIDEAFPQGQGKVWRFQLGPGGGSKIEAAFKGPDPKVLRQLANQAKAILVEDGGAVSIKDDWRRPVPVVETVYSENQGQRLGISRSDVSSVINEFYNGRQRGVYREGTDLIPIVTRAPEAERQNIWDMPTIPIISPNSGASLPLAQVIDDIHLVWRDSQLQRTNRELTIKAQADPAPGVAAADLQDRVRDAIENIELPGGYTFNWQGESGDSAEAEGDLFGTLPLAFLAMVLVVVLVFNSLRQPLIVWLVVPLGIIGVVVGLVLLQKPLEFIALLGVLSLSGLLLQNSMVLVDHTDNLISDGMPRFDALVESAASRLRPVTMGAFTTVLGVMPLYFDAFFQSMTVVLVFGLSFATLITLLVTPVLYSLFFGINPTERSIA